MRDSVVVTVKKALGVNGTRTEGFSADKKKKNFSAISLKGLDASEVTLESF